MRLTVRRSYFSNVAYVFTVDIKVQRFCFRRTTGIGPVAIPPIAAGAEGVAGHGEGSPGRCSSDGVPESSWRI